MMTAEQIIARLDGSASISRETDTPLTTIEGWKEVNFVPTWRQPTLIALAKRLGRPLAKADFPTRDHRKPRERADSQAEAA